MNREIVQILTEKLSSIQGLDAEQSCGQFTELAYLCHFTQCYRPAMHITDWQRQPIYIMEDAGVKTGIAFCDLQLPSLFSTSPASNDQNLTFTVEGTNISELWLVFVANGLTCRSPFFKQLIDSYDLSAVFDKIFLFDFFQSTIHIIKSHENHN